MIDHLIRIIAPHRCYNCRTLGAVLCLRCVDNIVIEGFSQCVLCRHPTPGSSQLCKTCRKTTRLENAWCIGWRENPLKKLIDDYKFEAKKQAVESLTSLLDARLPILKGITVTEVPTSRNHVRQLGYDHAQLLARHIAKRRQLNYQQLLKRVGRQTQHFSGRRARQAQAAKLFAAAKPIDGPVLLVDDIVTTGSSIKSAAKILRQAGATQVYGAVLVRQPLD